MTLADIVLAVAGVYSGTGLLFAAAFVTAGVGRIDHVAREAPLGFRLIILPASAALWPLLLVKWIRS